MKRFLSLFAVLAIGCGGASSNLPPPPAPPPAYDTVQLEIKDMTISHDNWSVTVPGNWSTSDKPETVGDGDLTQVLESQSARTYGRGPIRFSLLTSKIDPADFKDIPAEQESLIYAQVVAQLGPSLFNGAEVAKQSIVVLDGRPASLSLLKLHHGLGLALVGTAASHVGYVLTCGGDVMLAQQEVSDACIGIIKTFHVK